ncbi:MAG TPA: hypothetical protein VG537_08720 [Candidatus Kapabacteria bacterium]|jgi:hypothetical protein|nr:hypothetical protein [Candidatus Kapabacteria bacterium]
MSLQNRFFFASLFDGAFLIGAFASLSMLLSGCAITRTETDYYTITDRDTTFHETVRNVPGSTGDNGVVFPSSKVTEADRTTLSHDSTYDRKYPNFLRAGGIETAGFIGSSSLNGLGTGLFGIYDMFTAGQFTGNGTFWHPLDPTQPSTTTNHLFKGELIRLAPFEYRLRWFNDAPNWTVGWSAFELLAADENRNNWLTSVGLNAYLRRRFFIRDRIPYIIFAPFLGASAYPSAYVNLGAELQLGSLAGLNLRAYAGLASGFTWGSGVPSTTFPYLGLGVSVLDFTNRVEETEREWKYYVHSGININIFEGSLFKITQNYLGVWSDSTIPFQGAQIKIGSVEIPLPFANYHFWAGTSLLNWMPLGFAQQGFGILPVRVGYRQYIIAEDLMLEPFFEYNYYPSSFINAGARLKLDTYTGENIGITLGYASGNPGNFAPQAFNTAGASSLLNFSTAYLGVTVYLGDWNWSPEKIRALRASEE